MRFAPQPRHHTGHVPLRNPCAPRSQGEPIQSNGADGDGDDNGGDGGVDDGDQAFTATALLGSHMNLPSLTDDGTALAERVPSANFNMQKTGPIWRGDRKEFRDCAFIGAVPGHSTAPLGKPLVDVGTACENDLHCIGNQER
jgi:hypothetical protein